MSLNLWIQPLLATTEGSFKLNQFLVLYLIGAVILFFIGAGIGLFIFVRYFKDEKDTPWVKYFLPAFIGGAGGLFFSPLVIFLGFALFR